MNKNIMKQFGFESEVALVESGKCPFCRKSIDTQNPDAFKDDLSRKEFSISGLCQKCQDNFFG